MRIRVALTNDDYASARVLFEEYAASLDFDLGFQDFDDEVENLRAQYDEPLGCILLAEIGGRRVGCVGLRRFDGPICEMKRLYVRPADRSHGVGRALARAIMRRARDMGYKRMRLDTVASMTAANQLYESLGFHAIESYRPNPIAGARYYELVL